MQKKLRESLTSLIKGLIIQEVRFLQLKQSFSPQFILDEMGRSIDEIKRQVIAVVRWMPEREREVLLKRFIRQSVDEEIDQAIRLRQKKCFRCIHVRYFDEEGAPHTTLPAGDEKARVVGCEIVSSPFGEECRRFVESSLATSLEDYLDEMSILYEVKEMFEGFERIWEDYLTK